MVDDETEDGVRGGVRYRSESNRTLEQKVSFFRFLGRRTGRARGSHTKALHGLCLSGWLPPAVDHDTEILGAR